MALPNLARELPARRRFIVLFAAALAAAGLPGRALAWPVPLDVERFMALSRVLTGVSDPGDAVLAGRYLTALLARPDGAAKLMALWQAGGFGGAVPPASVGDLAARGVYADPMLAELADTITRQWYTGRWTDPDGAARVATHTDALAWRTLGYRPAGPGTCGGAFGHWTDAPST